MSLMCASFEPLYFVYSFPLFLSILLDKPAPSEITFFGINIATVSITVADQFWVRFGCLILCQLGFPLQLLLDHC